MFNSVDSVTNILKFFISSNKDIIVIVDDLKVRANVIKVNEVNFYLKFSLMPEFSKLPYGISCFIPYGKDLFFFNTEIINVEDNIVTAVIPASVIKKHSREYERYNVEGILFSSLNVVKEIDDREFLNRFPLAMRSLFDKGLSNVSYDEVLEKIMSMLEGEFGSAIFIDEFSQLPWLKYCRYNKTALVIPDIDSKSFLEPYRMYNFATYGFFLEPNRRNLLDSEVKFFVNYHTSRGFRSYMYVPLFVVDTLLGYIAIASNNPIKLDDFSSVSRIMKVLGMCDLVEQFFCYNRFFVINEHRDYPIPVIDISFGGMKVKIDKHISYFINVGDTVKVYFKIGSKFFEFVGDVIRTGIENEKFIAAIKFLNMDKLDFAYIKKWFGSFERW